MSPSMKMSLDAADNSDVAAMSPVANERHSANP